MTRRHSVTEYKGAVYNWDQYYDNQFGKLLTPDSNYYYGKDYRMTCNEFDSTPDPPSFSGEIYVFY